MGGVKIKGIQKLSTIDYPGRLACILFTGGCNFRCKYCHNPELIPLENAEMETISEEAVLDFLEQRRGKLDGVSITGGEPTLHRDLPELIRKIKDSGFLVKLDTNGTNPEMVERLIREGLVDYWAMDVKQVPEKYEALTGFGKVELLRKSMKLIMGAGVEYEFRSTILADEHSKADLVGMAKMIEGAERYYLQNFRPGETLDPAYAEKRGFTPAELKELCEAVRPYVKKCEVRDWQD